MVAMATNVKAAARGVFPTTPTCRYTCWPMKNEESPNIDGRMKSPSVNENVKIEPAMSPGFAEGSTMRRNVNLGLEPRSLDAAMDVPGTRSSAASIGRIINGSHRYV